MQREILFQIRNFLLSYLKNEILSRRVPVQPEYFDLILLGTANGLPIPSNTKLNDHFFLIFSSNNEVALTLRISTQSVPTRLQTYFKLKFTLLGLTRHRG